MTKKAAQKKKAAAAGSKSSTPRAPAQQVTASQLFQQAQIALQYDDFESAKTAFKRAVKLEPQNCEILEAYGALLAELGDAAGAAEVLQRAVAISPNSGHEKFMYLAQLLEDPQQAVQCAQHGVKVLQTTIDGLKANLEALTASLQQQQGTSHQQQVQQEKVLEAQAELADLSKQLCEALCSVAEMTLTTATVLALAAAEAAGQDPTSISGVDAAVAAEVESLCTRAAQVNESSAEPAQVMASLRYEQGKAEEALQLLRKSMELWFTPREDSDDEGGPADLMEEDPKAKAGPAGGGAKEDEEDRDMPSFEFRFECAKLLLELDESTQTAVQVLEDLLEEDDSNPDVWHLLALAYYSGHQYGEAAETLAKGRTILQQLGIPKDDDVMASFNDLAAAIAEAQQLQLQQPQA